MKYKAFFIDDLATARQEQKSMTDALVFSEYTGWDIQGDLDDIELETDDNKEFCNIAFANIESTVAFGDYKTYIRGLLFWHYIVFFLEDNQIILINTKAPDAINNLQNLIGNDCTVESLDNIVF